MKNKPLLMVFVLLTSVVSAAAQTRPANVTWQPPTVGGVLNYTLYECTVPTGATSCVPNVSGTPIATVTTTSYSATLTTGVAYGITVVANYSACTLTSSLTVPCGGGGSVTVGYIPAPPQGSGAQNIVIVLP
jgi:hypothetical protein